MSWPVLLYVWLFLAYSVLAVWQQECSKLVGTGSVGRQGVSVAVSSDGNTLALGVGVTIPMRELCGYS